MSTGGQGNGSPRRTLVQSIRDRRIRRERRRATGVHADDTDGRVGRAWRHTNDGVDAASSDPRRGAAADHVAVRCQTRSASEAVAWSMTTGCDAWRERVIVGPRSPGPKHRHVDVRGPRNNFDAAKRHIAVHGRLEIVPAAHARQRATGSRSSSGEDFCAMPRSQIDRRPGRTARGNGALIRHPAGCVRSGTSSRSGCSYA